MDGFLVLITTLVLGSSIVGGVYVVLKRRLEQNDRDRVCYSITFPQEIEFDTVVSWVRTIARTTASRHKNHLGAQSIAFETAAIQGVIGWRLLIPWQIADDIAGQIRALMPGVNVQKVDRAQPEWTYAVEVGLKRKNLPLYLPEPHVIAHSILASLTPLEPDETVGIQWVVVPAPREALPTGGASNTFGVTAEPNKDVLSARREKLGEPNLLGVMRVMVRAKSEPRARHLVDRVRSSFRATETPFNQWVINKTRLPGLLQRVRLASSMAVWPAQLSATELAALLAWPVEAPNVSGIPRGASRHMPAMPSVSRTGLMLGHSTFPGDERPIAIDLKDTSKHVWLVGPTGSGKTEVAANLVEQIMNNGSGMLLVETKRDLFRRALDLVPHSRLNDVIIIDVEDAESPVGFNLLDGDPLRVIDDLETIVSSIHGDDKNVWLKEVMYFGLRTLMTQPGATVGDLPALLSPRYDEVPWRDELIRNLDDPELLHFWQRLENQGTARRDQIVAPVLSRFWHFNRPQLRANFGQRQSAFTMQQAVEGNKLVFVNLTGVDRGTMQILGSMMVNMLRREVWKGNLERPFYLVADEVQNVLHLPIGISDMLAQARSFKLGLIMANQSAHQLPLDIRQAVMANARTKVAFQCEVDDAKIMAQQFGSGLTEHDFMNLRNYDAYARIATDDGVSPPVSFHPLEPAKPRGTSRSARLASQHNYGKSLGEVEAEVHSWRQAKSPDAGIRKRPKISGDDWA
jgi:hypothetical protein